MMEKQLINPQVLAPPKGFNHGILTTGGQILWLAGQDASDENGVIVAPGDVVGQYEQVLKNFRSMVTAAGGEMQDIVKLNIFVKDRHDYLAHLKELGRVHRSYFGNYYPTMALFEVNGFFQDDCLVECEGTAVIG
jgi:enamine deaminase RidA (YjgF/YER057c/UK114 family)